MRKILAASFGDSIGDDALRSLVPLLAVTLVGLDGFSVGVLGAIPFLWFLLGSTFIGWVVTALGYWRALVVGNAIRILTAALFAFLVFSGNLNGIILMLVAVVLGWADAVFTTGRNSFIPQVVGPEKVSAIYQRVAAVEAVTRTGSPAPVAVLLRFVSQAAAVLVGVVGYTIGLIAALTLRPAGVPAATPEGGKKTPAGAERWSLTRIVRTDGLGASVSSAALLNLATMALSPALLFFALNDIGLSAPTVALLGAVGGAIVGAINPLAAFGLGIVLMLAACVLLFKERSWAPHAA